MDDAEYVEQMGWNKPPRKPERLKHFCGCCGQIEVGDAEWCAICAKHVAPGTTVADVVLFHARALLDAEKPAPRADSGGDSTEPTGSTEKP